MYDGNNEGFIIVIDASWHPETKYTKSLRP